MGFYIVFLHTLSIIHPLSSFTTSGISTHITSIQSYIRYTNTFYTCSSFAAFLEFPCSFSLMLKISVFFDQFCIPKTLILFSAIVLLLRFFSVIFLNLFDYQYDFNLTKPLLHFLRNTTYFYLFFIFEIKGTNT